MERIPGYTGYQPGQNSSEMPACTFIGEKDEQIAPTIGNHVPGYQGHLPGIKSENVYAKTYGRTSKASMEGDIVRGADVGTQDRYTSTNTAHFTDQRALNAQMRAVPQVAPTYTKDAQIPLNYEEAMLLAKSQAKCK